MLEEHSVTSTMQSIMEMTINNQSTSQRILDIAERLVQTRGFNSFSYADIAAELGLTKASLHYHFPSKGDLGNQLIERYEATLLVALAAIDQETKDPLSKLRRYADLYATVLRNNRMCCCGVLSAEYSTLPPAMQEACRGYSWQGKAMAIAGPRRARQSGILPFGAKTQYPSTRKPDCFASLAMTGEAKWFFSSLLNRRDARQD